MTGRWMSAREGCSAPRIRLAVAASAALLALASGAQADVRVFANPADAPVDPGFAWALPAPLAGQTLPIFVDGGATPSTVPADACTTNTADGEELCGYGVELVATSGAIRITGFTPEPQTGEAIVWSITTGPPDRLSIVWADPAAPLLGAQRIGALSLDTVLAPGALHATSGGAVLGQLGWTPLDPVGLADVVVPEPGFMTGLVVACLLLGALAPGRRRRRLAGALIVSGGIVAAGQGAALTPTMVVDPAFQHASLGEDHSCGVMTDGRLLCWGDDTYLQVSNAPSGVFTRVDAGHHTTCAIAWDGALACWGGNTREISLGLPTPPPLPVGRKAVNVSVGEGHACAVLDDRSLHCWGENTFGEATPMVARATETAPGLFHTCVRRPIAGLTCWGGGGGGAHIVPAPLEGVSFEYVGAGEEYNCALRSSGQVNCWGLPAGGRTVPPPGVVFESIQVGPDHSCGVVEDGSLDCWGVDLDGETMPPAGNDFVAAYVGDRHSCARTSSGTMECWGNSAAPENIVPGTRRSHVTGGDAHSCAFGPDRVLACWGSDSAGQASPPVAPAVTSIDYVDAGRRHTCALGGGEIDCWGLDTDGQATVPFFGPLQGPWLRVATGGDASCGLHKRVSGTEIVCWGDATHGQLASPSGDFEEIDVGDTHACAIDSAGELHCWGDATDGKTSPPGGAFVEIAAGSDHSCGIAATGEARCWGDDAHGQSARQHALFSRITAGERHSCGLLVDGRLRCWGDPADGRTTPPAGLFESVDAGRAHTCATRVGGGVACWGDEGATANPVRPPLDSDADGLDDGTDNCPVDANPDQLDTDADGAGDACDVCPAFPDVEQLDYDGDGVGDRCDGRPRIEVQPGPTADTSDVYLDCRTATLTSMDVGVVIPGGFGGAADFGDGCVGAPDCGAANILGFTVDAAASSAAYHPTLGYGHSGSLELHMVGTPNLCLPTQRNFIGRINVLPPTPISAILPLPAPSAAGAPTVTNSDGFAIEPVHQTSASTLETFLLVQEGVASGTWTVLVNSLHELHRATFGVRLPTAPVDTTVNVIAWGATVDGVASTVLSPDHGTPGMRDDTAYFQIIGNVGLLDAMNQAQEFSDPEENAFPLVTFSTAASGTLPVILESEGVDLAFVETPFVQTNATEILLEEVGYAIYSGTDDTDSDGPIDENDNCPFAWNPPVPPDPQLDSGGFELLPGTNFVGDACECGDLSGDGAIFETPDLDDMAETLTGQPGGASTAVELCSVTVSAECDALDLVVLDLAFDQEGPGVQGVCEAAVGAPLQSP